MKGPDVRGDICNPPVSPYHVQRLTGIFLNGPEGTTIYYFIKFNVNTFINNSVISFNDHETVNDHKTVNNREFNKSM